VVRRVAPCCPSVLGVVVTPLLHTGQRMLQHRSLARHATRHPCSLDAAVRPNIPCASRLHGLGQAAQRQYPLPVRRSPSTTRTRVATPSTASKTKKDEIEGPSTDISVIYARLQRVSRPGLSSPACRSSCCTVTATACSALQRLCLHRLMHCTLIKLAAPTSLLQVLLRTVCSCVTGQFMWLNSIHAHALHTHISCALSHALAFCSWCCHTG
jgi:hypothetical protein